VNASSNGSPEYFSTVSLILRIVDSVCAETVCRIIGDHAALTSDACAWRFDSGMKGRGVIRWSGFFRFLVLGLILNVAVALAGCSRSRADATQLAILLGVRLGMVVADVGAGRGEMTVVMAELVGPKGRVYSTDIDPNALSKIRAAIKNAGLNNVTVVRATANDTDLPENCCDAIFLSRVYHYLTDPTDTDRSLYRALRPGGSLAVLDFRSSLLLRPWKPKGLPPDREGHGIDPVIVSKEMTRSGFEYLRMVDPWPGSWFLSTYCLLFEKPPS
jgi:ubiquinone/menaquinone biosynthesis C-methylase UbiE